MSTLGMVVRDDLGGLGNLTYDVFKNVRPEVTVIVQARPCRGTPRTEVFNEPWTEVIYTANPMTRQQWRNIAPRADTWWTAETWYCNEAERVIKAAGKRSILYAMPELFNGSQADEVWNPTRYLSDRRRLSDVMDWPTTPPSVWRERTSVKRLLHLSGGAQYDRNGTEIFIDAMRQVTEPCEVMLHQPDETHQLDLSTIGLPGHVTVRQSLDYFNTMDEAYEWADVLVIPRRYAGLCLPAFEAFGHGCLVMMSDTDPQCDWPIVPVQAIPMPPARMRGGAVPMVTVDPSMLARRIESLLTADPVAIGRQSREGRAWSETRSWDMMRSMWTWRLKK